MAAGDIIIEDGVITASILDKIASEVEQRLASTAKDPGEYEEVASLTGVSSMPVFQVSGNVYRLVRVAVSILHGKDGREVSFRVSDEYVQWRYTDGDWQNLISLAELRKPAEEAAAAANEASQKANTAAAAANEAASSANEAASSANAAALSAKTGADAANKAADRVDESITDITEEKNAAIAAAMTANENAAAANNAAIRAETAAQTANAAANGAEGATEEATGKIAEMNAGLARLEELEETLTALSRQQPTGMTVDYPKRITLGNQADNRITVTLSPAGTGKNVLFLSDDKIISVSPDGRITPLDVGGGLVHVIPTENTAIYKSIRIEVEAPSIRLAGSLIRLTANNNIRFN